MPAFTHEFEAIGTSWFIEAADVSEVAALRASIGALVEDFDRNYSRFRNDSLVSKMADSAGTYQLPDDAKLLIDCYRDAYDLTDGIVTPLIGQVLSDAGYDKDYSLKAGTPVSPPAWDDVLSYSFPKLTLKTPALLDFGAAGKGYLVDIVGTIISDHTEGPFLVDAGGDMCIRNKEVHIGMEDPHDPSKVIGVITLSSGALCGSSGSKRAWQGYHHVIDPFSLASPHEILAVWCVAADTLTADMATTCLFLGNGMEYVKKYGVEYAILLRDYSLDCSDGFPAELFT